MTLVLKSNNMAINAISDKHGLLAARDWRLMLDFENEDYLIQKNGIRTTVDINECVETENENAFIYDKNNKYSVLQKNSLRLSLNKKKDAFGLCEEVGFTEWYFPSNNPVSKTIKLQRGEKIGPYLVRVSGSGSVTLAGDGLERISNSLVTAENPATLYSNSVSVEPTLSLIISGDVTHLSVISTNYAENACIDSNFAKSMLSTWGFYAKSTRIKTQKINDLLANQSNFTIVFQCIDNEYLNVKQNGVIYKPLLEISNLNNHISIMKRRRADTIEELAVRLYTGSETVSTISGVKRSSVIAITSGDDGLQIAMDGKVSSASRIMSGFKAQDMLVGSSELWLQNTTGRASAVFTKLAIYDRQLTSKELEKVTLSFQ